MIFPITLVSNLILVGAVLFVLLLYLMLAGHHYAGRLEKQGKLKESYRLNQIIYRLSSLPLLSFPFPIVLINLSRQAEQLEGMEKALHWATLLSDERFPVWTRLAGLKRSAQLLRKQGKNEDAEALEAKVLTLQPTSERTTIASTTNVATITSEQANLLITQGHFMDALQMLSLPVFDDLWQYWAGMMRANALRYLGRYDEAITEQSRALEDCVERMSQYRKRHNAIPRFDRVSSWVIDSFLRRFWRNEATNQLLTLIQLFLETGRVGTAGEYWQRVPEELPTSEDVPLKSALRAWLLAARGDSEESCQQITALGEVKDTAMKAGYPLARALMALRNYPQAIRRLQDLIDANTDKPLSQAEYRFLLAQCYERSEHEDLARSEYRKVIEAGFGEAAFTIAAREWLSREASASSVIPPQQLDANRCL